MPAVEAAEFLLTRLESLYGARARQARRSPPLPCVRAEPAVRAFAERRFLGMRELESRSLVAWANRPEMAELCRRELGAEEIVSLQAEGRRCVSLLAEHDAKKGIEFALHDLRHLGKFFEPSHHRAQRGFFVAVRTALASAAWRELDALLDERWRSDRDSVLADMNGSPVFLFSILKMKLKMAARRRQGWQSNVAPPDAGRLSDDELAGFAELLELCLDGFELPPDVRQAARAISSKRDALAFAQGFVEYFELLS